MSITYFIINFFQESIERIYITSSNSLKRETLKNCCMNPILKEIITKMELPKFIWCVDIASIEDFKKEKTSLRIIIDSTCSSLEYCPWLLIHDNEKIEYYDNGKWYREIVKIDAYDNYKNNLRRFES